MNKFEYLVAYISAGDWAAARAELRNILRLAIWRHYRCVQAWEIHYPAKDDEPKRVVEFDPDEKEELVAAVHYYLYPGCDVKLYIRYASGRRKRICLR